MRDDGFVSLLPRVNQLWGRPRRVELDLDGVIRQGTFAGIGEEGQLLLKSDSGRETAYNASEVRHLKELKFMTKESFPRLAPAEAAALIQNGQSVAFSGFTPAGAPKEIPKAIAAARHDCTPPASRFALA